MTASDEIENSLSVPERVELEHPFFSAVEGASFVQSETSGKPVMRLPLDGSIAELSFGGIQKELGLDESSSDLNMLLVIEKALNFVPGIKIGDAVPSELHSGEASWEISDKHRAIAQARLSMQLVSWLSGDEAVLHDSSQLEMIAEDPAMKEKINEAFGEAAVKLGIDRENREEVVDLVNGLGEELAYIEALQDQFTLISVVEQRLAELKNIYRSERSVMDELAQVIKLCEVPMQQYREGFAELDAQTGEVIAVLKNMAAQVKFIRTFRDDLHQRFWAWKPLVEKWTQCPARRSRECEGLITETYQFLAQRFLPQSEWDLFSKAQEEAAKKQSETVW